MFDERFSNMKHRRRQLERQPLKPAMGSVHGCTFNGMDFFGKERIFLDEYLFFSRQHGRLCPDASEN